VNRWSIYLKKRRKEQKMEKTFFLRWMIIGFILIFQMPFLSSADESIPSEILDSAKQGIRIFIKDPRVTDLQRFGFSSQKEIDGTTLGMGFQVFKVPPESILKEGISQDFYSMVVPTNLWEFIILSGGEAKVLITVDLMNGKWTPVSMRAAGLSKEMNKAIETWPASTGYRYKFIRVYQAKSDFLGLSLGEKIIGIIPFTSARMAMGLKEREFDPLDLYNSEDVINKIRPEVRKNIE
jgi:hypothetical protein